MTIDATECTFSNTGVITGVWIQSPVASFFSTRLAIERKGAMADGFRALRNGKEVMSVPAKQYLWDKYIAWLDQKELFDQYAERESKMEMARAEQAYIDGGYYDEW